MYIFPILLSLLFSISAYADSSEATSSHLKLSLISEVQQYENNKSFKVGILVTPDPEWHIYWLNPGDSGSVPKFDWSSSFNAEVSEAEFPLPHKIPVGPLANFGYENETLISFNVQPVGDNDITLKVDTEFLVCQEECIPANALLSINIPRSNGNAVLNPDYKDLFSKARAQEAIEYPSVALKTYQDSKNLYISGILPPDKIASSQQSNLQFFPFKNLLIKNSALQKIKIDKDSFKISISKHQEGKDIAGIEGILVSDTGWASGIDSPQALQVKSDDIPKEDVVAVPSGNLGTAILLAFLGGLILNLMPCVFPVLTIKIFSIIDSSQHYSHFSKAKASVLFTLGVISSFLTLALFIVASRQTGESLGWGFQLQSPAFVAALAALMLILSLNFLGVFEIGASIQNLATRKQQHFYKKSFSENFSHFLDGVLVTALATPCTAPFMGSAMAYGLSAPALHMVLVFTALGLGTALPFALLNLSPALAAKLPKPGAWMLTLKKLLAFPLLATCLWLIWVYGLQTSVNSLVTLLTCLLLISFCLFMYGHFAGPSASSLKRKILSALALASFSCVFFIPSLNQSNHKLEWQPYSESKVIELRKQGKAVYVDFTAAWCITCQVNKIVALESAPVINKIKELDIAMLKADWTNKDPEITKAIQEFQREGVPLNVIYPSNLKEDPEILPQILTPAIVIEALERNNAEKPH